MNLVDESRLKDEYGGSLVNTRRPGEAIMIGGDLAVMVVRVKNGNQVHLAVASKTRQSILREEKYRENQNTRRDEGKKDFHPFYKTTSGFTLSARNGGKEISDKIDGITIARFDSNLEAEAYAEGVKLADPSSFTEIDRQHRDIYVLVYRHNGGPFRFLDYSKLLQPTTSGD